MSACHTPKGTPVQRSPSDGEGGHLSGSQSPQHPDAPSTPLGEAERKRLVSSILQSPSFREDLDVLIQEQVKRGSSSSSLWALKQIAEFMASQGSPATLPVSASSMALVTPINDLTSWEPPSLAKGERLMRCKLASVYRLLDLYGWAQLSNTQLTLRVSKEQDHFLVLPDGLAYSEATAANLAKVNILGEVVDRGCTTLGVDSRTFSLHSAIYSARPDTRCLLHLHTPATAAVSAMKCGLLPLSHEALLVGEVAYYDYNGAMEDREDRVELQKSLGPTCKVLVLRNHGIVALGESVEEAFYAVYHIQAACQIQVSALCSAGGEQNLIMLDRGTHKPSAAGTVGWAGSTFGPLHKSRLGEHEFEAVMRTLDNLGYRTGYAYRFPVLLERAKARREVEVPATVTSFSFQEEGERAGPRQQAYSQKQQQERTRWLNTPNTYQRVSQDQASPGHQRTTWLKTEEATQGSGTAIKIENPNQFVPLFTNPQEVLQTRNKIREQNRQDMKTAGPQSQLLAGVITEKSPPSTETELAAGLNGLEGEPPKTLSSPEPEPPNPFNELTDKELEEYKQEVERKQQSGVEDGGEELVNEKGTPPASSPEKCPSPTNPPLSDEVNLNKATEPSKTPLENGKEEDQRQEELEKSMKALSTNETSPAPPTAPPAAPPSKPTGPTPEGSPSKSPSKKKKKFKAPSFLKKSKKQKDKSEA
ncbi:beta-adducin isoform X1 [Brienomyrus brachyistius]|uniref:beta-adducin isoform X1 n=2 Tax=Brienomyrus brachyistius TaxID=42636 RepID=UPI0020B2F7C9|nr:beta-adducin isoform X1 [Brienomyrus brachyistius]XP_048854541.1 beta-adducin isoform X1 [Brienomyrus brachyistius]XP_048854542.1 beta-adducin isoform X1 [Brienomyrus brachyistius]XP_048854543.1 beta-adducin isoform X1 [Brienomyrus brachyistius]XP_048854545.1 beta-adducin isoform X1 [Brienomyrus brachyistius]